MYFDMLVCRVSGNKYVFNKNYKRFLCLTRITNVFFDEWLEIDFF
jgi:hypothetical protein